MKTREIDIWLSEEELSYMSKRHYQVSSIMYTKAKLIIEIPEEKITISEDELNEAARKVFGNVSHGDTFREFRELLGFNKL